MKSTCTALAVLSVLASGVCFAADNHLVGKSVVHLGGEMKKTPAKWVGKNVSDIVPEGKIQKIIILRSRSSAPLSLHEAAVGRLWTVSVKTIEVKQPLLDRGAWFDAVVALKTGDYVRVTFWNKQARFVTPEGVGYFDQKKIYVQPQDAGDKQ